LKIKIGVIGAGVVGTATGKGFHKLGHNVIFYDILKDRVSSLKEQGFQVSSNVKDIISNTELSFICVNTPTNSNGQQDLSQVMSALFDITGALNSLANKQYFHHHLVFRSTLLPGTMKNVIVDYFDKNCSLERGKHYNICYNPEFLRKDSFLEDFLSPDRVVIGEDKKGVFCSSSSPPPLPFYSSLALKQLYQRLTNKIIITDYDTAEMIKYASNCFLSLKISFFNEIGLICRHLGIDDEEVSSAVSLDRRIGKYGTKAGRPFDGMCLPKDTQALVYFVKRLKILKPDLLQVALDINEMVAESILAKQLSGK
jgi:nucleotide sugar dehydrogenase